MLGSKFLNKKTKKTKVVLKFEQYYKSFSDFYADTLNYWITKMLLKNMADSGNYLKNEKIKIIELH